MSSKVDQPPLEVATQEENENRAEVDLILNQVTKTDTIIAYYAPLALVDMSNRFMVQQRTPICFVASEYRVGTFQFGDSGPKNALKALEKQLLKEWHRHWKNRKRELKAVGLDWVYNVSKVQLIECELLVPKNRL